MQFRYIINLLFVGFLTHTSAQEPNVIIIMTDDQGYGEFSCHGNPLLHTPNIDHLATTGISFTDFHVAPMCTPTRGQLLTGMDAFRNGAINVSSGRTLLRPDLKTIADIFRENGYRTGIFGKWHLGDNYPFRPEDRGFDECLWFPSSHVNSLPDYWDNDYFDDTYIHNGKRQQYEGYCTDLFFNEAIKWIDRGRSNSKPFFAYIALNAAHWPHFVPDRFRNAIQTAITKNPGILDHIKSNKRRELISFLAMGANVDENVGRLNDFLSTSTLNRNTLLVFLTDNGSTFGQDYYNAGMRGKKTELWEGGHRVPLFINGPKKYIPSPKAITDVCQVQDLLPTLADMAGIQNLPQNLDGTSLYPVINGQKEHLDDRMLVINYSRMPMFKVKYTKDNPAIPMKDGAGILWKNWRFLENRELYDVLSDPHQDKDISVEHPEIVEKMSRHLDQWWDEIKSDVHTPQRVIIGNDRENPMLLSACEWLDVFVDQQAQVRRGDQKNGTWHITVDQPGTYTFELRRWPREAQSAISAGLPEKQVTDGTFIAGAAFPIKSARMAIGTQQKSSLVRDTDQFVAFSFDLEKGDHTLQTWFGDASGANICGAYYVYAKRI